MPEDELRHYGVSIELHPKGNWIPRLIGWVEGSMIAEQPVDDWLMLKVEVTDTRGALVAREGKPLDHTDWDRFRGKNADDTYLMAEIRGPAHHLLKIYRIYFETV
jgi:hypothetical protein